MTAGREVPRVHGLLEKLLRVVLPELADRGVRMDDRVLQPAAHALHFADVDVLRGVAVRVHLHGAARRGASVISTCRRAAMRAARSSTLPPMARTASLRMRAPV